MIARYPKMALKKGGQKLGTPANESGVRVVWPSLGSKKPSFKTVLIYQ